MDMEALKAELKTTQDPSRRLVIVKQLGDLFLSQGNHVDALRAFESAAKFAPRDLEALRGLRLATIAAGQAKEALAVFQREMTMTAGDRERALLFRELGEHFQNRLNDFDNAQRAFAQARQLDAEVFSPAPAVAVAVAPEAAPVEAPPAAQEPPSPVDAAPTGAPSSPPPVPGVRPSSPRLAVRPPAKRSRAPLVLGGVVIVATAGAGGWFSMQGQEGPAAAPLPMPCSSKLERRADLLDPAGVIEQYECVNTLTSRRWKVRGGRVLEVAEAASGTLEGSIVLTPDPQTWIEGVNARGEASGTWRTWKAGLLDEEQDWVAGHRSGKRVGAGAGC